MDTMAVYTYDYDTCGLDHVADIGMTTVIAAGPKWCECYTEPGKYFFAGWNVYAINGDDAVLLETYEKEKNAVRMMERLNQLAMQKNVKDVII